MIEVRSVSKYFEDIKAVDHVNITIKEDCVFGLIGTNGAGKSTVLRMMSGVIKPDEGEIVVDGLPVFDNVEAKQRLFFIADEPYFFANATPDDMGKYYSSVFPILICCTITVFWIILDWAGGGKSPHFPKV